MPLSNDDIKMITRSAERMVAFANKKARREVEQEAATLLHLVGSKITADPFLLPPLPVLMKLGSIVVHADEFTSPGGHEFDLTALRNLLADGDVRAWVDGMTRKGYLPVKRSAR